MSRSLALLGNLLMLLSCPDMRYAFGGLLMLVVDFVLLDLATELNLEATFSRKKYSTGPATIGIQAQQTPTSPSRPLQSAMSLKSNVGFSLVHKCGT